MENIVEVKNIFEDDVLPLFLINLNNSLDCLKRYIKKERYDAIQEEAHDLRPRLDTIGFKKLNELISPRGMAAESQQMDLVRSKFNEISSFMKNYEIIYVKTPLDNQ